MGCISRFIACCIILFIDVVVVVVIYFHAGLPDNDAPVVLHSPGHMSLYILVGSLFD